jgi:hypothetical protein
MPIDRTPPLYSCDLSGLSATGLTEDDLTQVDEDDTLNDAPLGWSRITISTRIENVERAQYMKMYEDTVAQLRSDLKTKPDELQNAIWSAEAQFADVLDSTSYSTALMEMWVHPAFLQEVLKRLDPETGYDASDALDEAEALAVQEAASAHVNDTLQKLAEGPTDAEPDQVEQEAAPEAPKTKGKKEKDESEATA